MAKEEAKFKIAPPLPRAIMSFAASRMKMKLPVTLTFRT